MTFVKEFTLGTKKKKTPEYIKKAEELREKARAEDSKMVTGIFRSIEVTGGDLKFSYHWYKEDPYRTYYFKDGETHTIPLGVAKHINNNTKVKQHAYLVDKDGKKIQGLGPSRVRFQFLSTEFM